MNLEGFRKLISIYMYLECIDSKAYELILDMTCKMEDEEQIPVLISNGIFDAMEIKWHQLGYRDCDKPYPF